MSRKSVLMLCLPVTSLMTAGGGVALAQTRSAAPGDQIAEVVVTATRRADTVHNVPLAITAITADDLERRQINSAENLTQAVTALRVAPVNSGGAGGSSPNQDIAIRGVRSTTGAPTTGVYVDDVPLQARGTGFNGIFNFPNLFDLERVEVLKGPQGTLYGGSSQGGTIRFITPQPSVSETSLYTSASLAQIDNGEQDYEYNLAVGTPIVADKLGMRLGASYRRDGGYIDHVSRFSGNTIASDTNSAEHMAFHLGLAWKPTERSTATLAWLYQRDEYDDTDNYWVDIQQYTATTFLGSRSYGPYNMFGPYTTGQNTNIGDNFYTSDAQLSPLYTPHTARMSLPSLTLQYDFSKVTVKSITAYNQNRNRSFPDFSYVDIISRGGTPVEGPYNAQPANSPFIANMPNYTAVFASVAENNVLTEEIRISSSDPSAALSWVGGAYYYKSEVETAADLTANSNALFTYIAGVPLPNPLVPVLAYSNPTRQDAEQIAVFGEATYAFNDNWKATVGLRWTHDEFSFESRYGGPLFQLPFNTLQGAATVSESPLTPKFGLQYIASSDANIYVNAAQGYRPGGGNNFVPPTCQTFLTAAGFPNGAPLTYGSDSLWSYEGGTKLRGWGGKANVNFSAYQIDWKDVQTAIALGCGSTITVSSAEARSRGADIQSTFVLFPGFTAGVNVAYTDAKYTSSVFSAPGVPLIREGSRIPYTPKWTGNLSGEYRFDLMGRNAYVRADWASAGEFVQNTGPGTIGYQPLPYRLAGTDIVNARIGMTFGQFEVAAFVNNLTNSTDPLSTSGFAGGYGPVSCTNAPACTTFVKNSIGQQVSTFRPRTVGITVSYRN